MGDPCRCRDTAIPNHFSLHLSQRNNPLAPRRRGCTSYMCSRRCPKQVARGTLHRGRATPANVDLPPGHPPLSLPQATHTSLEAPEVTRHPPVGAARRFLVATHLRARVPTRAMGDPCHCCGADKLGHFPILLLHSNNSLAPRSHGYTSQLVPRG